MTDNYKFYIMGRDSWVTYYRISNSNQVDFFSLVGLEWRRRSDNEPRPLEEWTRRGLEITETTEEDFNQYLLKIYTIRELSR